MENTGNGAVEATGEGGAPAGAGAPERALLRPPGGYRGPDRRPPPPTLAPGRALALAAALLAAVSALAVTQALTGSGIAPGRDAGALIVWTLTATFATAAGTTAIVNWRVTGWARNVPYGVAFLVLGVAGFALGGMVPVLRPEPDAGLILHLLTGAELSAVVLLAVAPHLPEIDTRLRPVPLLAAAAILATVLAAAAAALPGRVVTAGVDPALALMWIAVGLDHVRLGRRQRRWLDTWIGLAALGMGAAGATALLAHATARAPDGPYLTVAVLATLYAVVAVQQELSLALARAREQAERMADAVKAVEEIHRRERSAREERDHDLRSALFAIEAAAGALGHNRRASDAVDDGLAAAIASELGRVKAMVASADQGSQAFRVSDAVLPIISLELARGVDLRAELPQDLEAFGSVSATAEIVRNLLDNAHRYAPGRPVRVTGEHAGTRILVRVTDRGPGIPAEHHHRLFERGWRATPEGGPAGTGLGLYVSTRLAAEQGGELTLDPSVDDGASFVLSLPAPPASAPPTPTPGDPTARASSDARPVVTGPGRRPVARARS